MADSDDHPAVKREARTALEKLGRPRPEIDEAALVRYMAYGYIPDPDTAFRGIRKLPPGSYQAKVAQDRDWTVNWGAGGVPNGDNIDFTVGADQGTLFLDEIGELPLEVQAKLLRVVQEQQITRVGGIRPIDIDVRFIVATNRHLEDMVIRGEFRQDLYHRLNVVKFTMPPLRERRDDIPLLIQHFVDQLAERYHRNVSGFDAAAMQQLMQYDWPGNVRELHNLVERHIALADGPVMHLQDLSGLRRGEDIDSHLPSLADLEHLYILKLLDRFDQSREKTAATLGINKSTLYRKLQGYRQQDDN